MDGARIVAVSVIAALLLIIVMERIDFRSGHKQRHLSIREITKDAAADKTQFIIHGRWKPGKKHVSYNCEFLFNKDNCCKKDQNLHFEFYDKKLNEIDAVQKLRRILNNKKLLLLGDSIMLEFFHGLVALLSGKTKTYSIPEAPKEFSQTVY